MKPKSQNTVPSGIEPVDKFLGGLEAGNLYLVHGEGPSKSLFAYKFLIEGLKRGETAALVINYSPQEAVRWFARLGFDCLEDIYNGRLVILECSDEHLKHIAGMKELAPVLNELKWLIGDRTPDRAVFEPVGRLLAAEYGSIDGRAREFTEWARGIGSTSLLIANGKSAGVVTSLKPLVRESFSFELKSDSGHLTRYFVFETSPDIPAQPIESDPAKGIFLIEGQGSAQGAGQVGQPAESANAIPPEFGNPSVAMVEGASGAARPEAEESSLEQPGQVVAPREQTAFGRGLPEKLSPQQLDDREKLLTGIIDELIGSEQSGDAPANQVPPEKGSAEEARSVFRRADVDEIAAAMRAQAGHRAAGIAAGLSSHGSPGRAGRHINARGTDARRVERAGTVEDLLRSPIEGTAQDVERLAQGRGRWDAARRPRESPNGKTLDPADFNVLIICCDDGAAKRISKALCEFRLETATDGVSGLAKLISFRPELVVLDLDLRAMDGFELLAHIRANLDVPIIALSSSRLRASDRIKSSELGADYYLVRPFSAKELKQKARQLIARYRGIEEWIKGSAPSARRSAGKRDRSSDPGPVRAKAPFKPALSSLGEAETTVHFEHDVFAGGSSTAPPPWIDPGPGGQITPLLPYQDFVAHLERMVEDAIAEEKWFSLVGCRPRTEMAEADGDRTVQVVLGLIRNGDFVSVNQSGDVMILLSDADQAGARAFTARLQETMQRTLGLEPSLWVRNFPVDRVSGD